MFESSAFQPRAQATSNREGFNSVPSQLSFHDEPDFHSTPLPSVMTNSKQLNSQLLRMTPLVPRPPNSHMLQKTFQNYSVLDVLNKKNQPQIRMVTERPIARFPGPAGVLVPILVRLSYVPILHQAVETLYAIYRKIKINSRSNVIKLQSSS